MISCFLVIILSYILISAFLFRPYPETKNSLTIINRNESISTEYQKINIKKVGITEKGDIEIYYRINALPLNPSFKANNPNNIYLVDLNNNKFKFKGKGELVGIFSTAGVLEFQRNSNFQNGTLILSFDKSSINLGHIKVR